MERTDFSFCEAPEPAAMSALRDKQATQPPPSTQTTQPARDTGVSVASTQWNRARTSPEPEPRSSGKEPPGSEFAPWRVAVRKMEDIMAESEDLIGFDWLTGAPVEQAAPTERTRDEYLPYVELR